MKAVFLKDFHYSSRKANIGWHIKANPEPQNLPSEVVEAAIAVGYATVVKPKHSKKSSGATKT